MIITILVQVINFIAKIDLNWSIFLHPALTIKLFDKAIHVIFC